jgi:hypothetical protein
MKYLIIAVFGVGIIAAVACYLNQPKRLAVSAMEQAPAPGSAKAIQEPSTIEPTNSTQEQPGRPAFEPGTGTQNERKSDMPADGKLCASMLKQAVDVLVSQQSTYAQKQATWKKLRDAGKLDGAITELEQRTAENPRQAEFPAALGQAYLKKCGAIQDVREQGILAMQADKMFDAALNLEPSNWEARFTKAVALSYWPATMNKGEEVIQHFTTLVQQQEAQASQPHFAETYAWLGDQYERSGKTEYAKTVWERGAALFPEHDGLKKRLASAQ